MVGLRAAYARSVEGDPDAEPPVPGLTPVEQQQWLGGISNKSYDDPELGDVVDAEVVDEVNRLLGFASTE